MTFRPSFDHNGEFDEMFIANAHVHIERMNETGFWIGIEVGGERLMLNTGVYRGKWFFNLEEDGKGGKFYRVERPRRKKPVAHQAGGAR